MGLDKTGFEEGGGGLEALLPLFLYNKFYV